MFCGVLQGVAECCREYTSENRPERIYLNETIPQRIYLLEFTSIQFLSATREYEREYERIYLSEKIPQFSSFQPLRDSVRELV